MWIDIKKVHPDQLIDWDKVNDDEVFPILAIVQYKEGSPDITIQEVIPPKYRGRDYGVGDDGFCYTGSMKKVSHWLPLPLMPPLLQS